MFTHKIIITLFLIVVSSLGVLAQVPNGDFWVLRTDHKTSDAIINTITNPKLDVEKINTTIKSLIRGRKVTEIVRFNQAIGAGVTKMKKVTGEIKFKTIQTPARPMGVFIEASAVLNDKTQAYDLSYTASILEKEMEEGKNKVKKKGISHYVKELKTTVTIINQDWMLLSQWRNENESTLILARFSGIPESPAEAKNNNVYTDLVILKASQINLKALKAGNPETCEKAIAKLKNSSEFIAGAAITSKRGVDVSYSDIYNCVFGLRSDLGDHSWKDELLGLTWEAVAHTLPGEEEGRVVNEGLVQWKGADILEQKMEHNQHDDIFFGIVFEENFRGKLSRKKLNFLGASKYVDNASQRHEYPRNKQIMEGLLPNGQFRILTLNKPNNKDAGGLIMLLTIKNK